MSAIDDPGQYRPGHIGEDDMKNDVPDYSDHYEVCDFLYDEKRRAQPAYIEEEIRLENLREARRERERKGRARIELFWLAVAAISCYILFS